MVPCEYSFTHEGEPYTETFVGCLIAIKMPDLIGQLSEDSLFHKTFHSNVIGMAILDDQHKIIDINESLCQIVGYEKLELIGKTALEIGLVTEENAENREEILRHLAKGNSIRDLERRVLSKTGSYITFLLSIEIFDLNGTPHHLVTAE